MNFQTLSSSFFIFTYSVDQCKTLVELLNINNFEHFRDPLRSEKLSAVYVLRGMDHWVNTEDILADLITSTPDTEVLTIQKWIEDTISLEVVVYHTMALRRFTSRAVPNW